jgi:hypothetical protein
MRFPHNPVLAAKEALLFDHLIGERKQVVGDIDAKCFCGFEIDHKLKLGRQHDRQIGGLLPLEDAADIDADLPMRRLLRLPLNCRASGFVQSKFLRDLPQNPFFNGINPSRTSRVSYLHYKETEFSR